MMHTFYVVTLRTDDGDDERQFPSKEAAFDFLAHSPKPFVVIVDIRTVEKERF